MTVGIYNPYHDTLGGGEQYMFSFASYFLNKNQTVIYYTSDPSEVSRAEERFGFDLSNIKIQKRMNTRELDLLLFYSDGSVPFSFAKKTYLIFQFPVPWVHGSSLLTSIKKTRITHVIVNSKFTKQFIDKTFSIHSTVVYPSVNIADYSSKNKENIILSVGRFTKGMNAKKHGVLIDTFKSMCDKGLKDWRLVIAGGVLDQDWEEIKKNLAVIERYPIQIKPNIDRKKLLELYSTSSIYWHAAGYREDEEKHPEKVEHFGISTLEAMASGAVPLVYPAGGQKEIVNHEKNGFWWSTIEDLEMRTISLINDKKTRERLSLAARERAKDFDRRWFFQKLPKIFLQ
jgi:glycosyltransferase involved in cell wall biosynthesis